MRNYLLLLIATSAFTAIGQDVWIQRDSVKGPPRANAATFVSNDDGYVVTGYDGFGKKRSAVSYDIDQDDWDSEVSIGGDTGDGLNRSSAIGFKSGVDGFVGLGEGSGFMFSDIWKYDRLTETWTQMADFGGGARTQAVSFTIDDTSYVGTGKGSDLVTLYNDFWKYDPANNLWTEIASFPGTGRMDAVGTDMTGKGYVGMGYDGATYTTDFYSYFPVTDTWTQIADFPGTPRINAVSFAVFPQLFIATGDDGFNYLNDTWEYNYFGDVWMQRTDFPGEPRTGAFSFVIENRPFVGGGVGSGTYYDDFYEYTILLSDAQLDNKNISLYPNPAINSISIDLSGIGNFSKYVVYDVQGKQMLAGVIQNQSKIVLDLNGFNNAAYYLALYDENNAVLTKQFVVQK